MCNCVICFRPCKSNTESAGMHVSKHLWHAPMLRIALVTWHGCFESRYGAVFRNICASGSHTVSKRQFRVCHPYFAVGCSRSAPRLDTWAVLLHLKVGVQPSSQCQEALAHFDTITKMTNRKGIQVLPLYYASSIVSTVSQHTEHKKKNTKC